MLKAAPTSHRNLPPVNNAFYDKLGDRWYDDDTHAVAYLRAESKLKLRYVMDVLQRSGLAPQASIRLLDIGCGAGFLSIPLAEVGYDVKGIDLSEGSLQAAKVRAHGLTNLRFRCEDAHHLTDPHATFDAVLMLDFLEHVETPAEAVAAAARVLKPGGILVFHTFNRTWASALLAIKALELLTQDCPKHLHVYRLFLKPRELATILTQQALTVQEMRGLRPKVGATAFWSSVVSRRMHPDFAFVYSASKAVGYLGFARKSL